MGAKCESCLMPLDKDPGPRESERYCSYCYKNGAFTYQGTDVREFQRLSYEGMRAQGMNALLAWLFSWMIQFAPRWKNAAGRTKSTPA